jgi:hypothetical protein
MCCSKLDRPEAKLVFAEVTRNRMTRQIEDTTWLKFVNTTNRNRKIGGLFYILPLYFTFVFAWIFYLEKYRDHSRVRWGGGGREGGQYCEVLNL